LNLVTTLFLAYVAVFIASLVWRGAATIASFAWRYALQERSGRNVFEQVVNPGVVVTLVHGTWAAKAAWTHCSSPLCTTLQGATTRTIQFERFLWSGANSIWARHKAVDKLTTHLHALIEKFPDAKHFVVGHSHGGNIAVHALRDPWLAQRIDGLICLSTPFLTVIRRQVDGAMMLGIIFSPLLILAATFRNPYALVAGGAFCMALWYALNKLGPFILDATAYPSLDPRRVLLMRTVADEASAAIGIAYFISRLMGAISAIAHGILMSGYQTVEQWRKSFVKRPILLTLSVIAAITFVIQNTPNSAPSTEMHPVIQTTYALCVLYVGFVVAVVTTGGTMTLIVAPLLLAVMAVPFVMIAAVCGIAVGPELCIVGILFHISAESTPPGHWHVWQITPTQIEGDIYLLHSMSYNDPRALRTIRKWFGSQVVMMR